MISQNKGTQSSLANVQKKSVCHKTLQQSLTNVICCTEDSIGRPLFVLFRNLAELSEDDSRRLPLLTVLSEMYSVQQKIGYLLLYYLQASMMNDEETNKSNR